MPKSDKLLGKNIPFVQAHHINGKQRPSAIVLRSSFTTGDAGAALGIAQAWHHPTNQVDSCHYVVDEIKTFRCVPDRLMCKSMYTEAFNRKAIVINVCHDPPHGPVDSIVYRTSKQVARLCRLHRIRPRILDEREQANWLDHPWKFRGGIILKIRGDFPTNNFLSQVDDEYRNFDFKDYYGTV